MAWDDPFTARDYDHHMGYDREPDDETVEEFALTAEDFPERPEHCDAAFPRIGPGHAEMPKDAEEGAA